MDIPIISDLTRQISRDYGVMLEDEGHTLRGLFIIDDKGKFKYQLFLFFYNINKG